MVRSKSHAMHPHGKCVGLLIKLVRNWVTELEPMNMLCALVEVMTIISL